MVPNRAKHHILLTTALSCACGILVTIHALPISRSILSNSSLFNERIWEMKQLSRCADGQMRLCSWWKIRVFSVNFSTTFTFSKVPKMRNYSKYYKHTVYSRWFICLHIMKINRSFTKLNNAKITSFSLTLNSDFHLPKKVGFICFNENPLKMMKNAFYFLFKSFFRSWDI